MQENHHFHQGSPSKKFPAELILDTSSMVVELKRRVLSLIDVKDIHELITQVCMSVSTKRPADHVLEVEFQRLRKTFNQTEQNVITFALNVFKKQLEQYLNNIGAYDNNDFPYFFLKLLDNDVVLMHIPY
jgi:hypothetical protein